MENALHFQELPNLVPGGGGGEMTQPRPPVAPLPVAERHPNPLCHLHLRQAFCHCLACFPADTCPLPP